MSSSLRPHHGVDTNKLSREIAHGTSNLHHVIAPKDGVRDESHAMSGIKGQVIQEAAAHGGKGLHHVDRPKDGISPMVRDAYLAEHGGASAGSQRGGAGCNKCQGPCQCSQRSNTCKCQGTCQCK